MRSLDPTERTFSRSIHENFLYILRLKIMCLRLRYKKKNMKFFLASLKLPKRVGSGVRSGSVSQRSGSAPKCHGSPTPPPRIVSGSERSPLHCIHPPCLVADGLYLPGAAFCAGPVRRDEGGRLGEAQRHHLTQQEVLPSASQVQLTHPGFRIRVHLIRIRIQGFMAKN
jgi:hypothetical protein